MQRRRFIQSMAALAAAGALPFNLSPAFAAVSVDDLPELKGELTLYLGRGEGSL
jgi:iron(III) transport system substrate-binding protein